MDVAPMIAPRVPAFVWTRRAWWRLPLAIALALPIGWYSGPFILSAGFGGWILGLFCMVACPFVICFVTDRWYFLLAPVTSLLVESSVSYQNLQFYKRYSVDPSPYWKMNLDITIATAIFSLLMSFGIAYAISRIRKA